jgi:hypothetical protein
MLASLEISLNSFFKYYFSFGFLSASFPSPLLWKPLMSSGPLQAQAVYFPDEIQITSIFINREAFLRSAVSVS